MRNGGRSSAHFLTGKVRRSCIYRPQVAVAFLLAVGLQIAPRFMGSYRRHHISAGMLITKSARIGASLSVNAPMECTRRDVETAKNDGTFTQMPTMA